MAKKVIAPFPAEAQAELAKWLAQHGEELPAPVRIALEQHAALQAALRGSRQELAALVRQLRRAMGVVPQSEKRRSASDRLGPPRDGAGPKPKTLRETLALKLERADRLSNWHLDIACRHEGNVKRIDKRLLGLPEEEAPASEQEALSPEEKAEREAMLRAHLARAALGDGPDPALASVSESLMSGAEVTTSEERVRLPAPNPNSAAFKVIDTRIEERVRYDFTMVVGRVVAEVEKKVVVGPDGRRRMLSASTAPLGPPRLGVTWRFLVNTAVMVVQYAMPMNRLARLLSTDDKRFTAASLARSLRYVAERFVPIYLHLFDELADAAILMGDDTSARVLEVRRYFADATSQEPSWAAYRNRDAAEETLTREGRPHLEAQLARELDFEFARRDGNGAKQSLNTTVVAGRSERDDPESLIVFYRSHLGGLGNLLEMLLERREPNAGGVTVQSDLSTVNLVHDPVLRDRFPIRQVGCASHARRPFALHEAEDEELCEIMLHHFKGLFIHEHVLDAYGRNSENVTAVRGVDDRAIWAKMKHLAELMTRKWSRETKLGEAARYIIRHYDELTAYLDDPRLEPTNNFSERMLRLEKLIEASSMFRASLAGRFVLDILRTIFQTAVAARVPLQEYVLAVLHSDPDNVAARPERFTPLAWRRAHLDPLDIDDEDSLRNDIDDIDDEDSMRNDIADEDSLRNDIDGIDDEDSLRDDIDDEDSIRKCIDDSIRNDDTDHGISIVDSTESHVNRDLNDETKRGVDRVDDGGAPPRSRTKRSPKPRRLKRRRR